MIKTITDIELLKRLQPFLKDVETEYVILSSNRNILGGEAKMQIHKEGIEDLLKTLTLEEAIEFLSRNANEKGRNEMNAILLGGLWDNFSVLEIFNIKIAEKMIDYLLTNNLLEQGQN